MNQIIEKQVGINCNTKNAWRVFTDPEVTKTMGGSYSSDWTIGGFFGWKNTKGEIITNGEIIEIEPGKLLKHKLFNTNEKSKVDSVITYKFIEFEGKTILKATEELQYPVSKEQLEEINQGWDFALEFVKNIAEKL